MARKIDSDVAAQFTEALAAVVAELLERQIEKVVEKEVEEAMENLDLPDFDDFLQKDDFDPDDYQTSDQAQASLDEVEEKLAQRHQALHERVELTLHPFDELRQPGWKGILRRLRFIATGK